VGSIPTGGHFSAGSALGSGTRVLSVSTWVDRGRGGPDGYLSVKPGRVTPDRRVPCVHPPPPPTKVASPLRSPSGRGGFISIADFTKLGGYPLSYMDIKQKSISRITTKYTVVRAAALPSSRSAGCPFRAASQAPRGRLAHCTNSHREPLGRDGLVRARRLWDPLEYPETSKGSCWRSSVARIRLGGYESPFTDIRFFERRAVRLLPRRYCWLAVSVSWPSAASVSARACRPSSR